MIVCSCAVVSDRDIDFAVGEIVSQPNALVPTPGVIFRHLQKKMVCCGCAPVAVSAIYAAMDRIADDTGIDAFALAEARERLERIELRGAARASARAKKARQPANGAPPALRVVASAT